jgi:hypothetical protein
LDDKCQSFAVLLYGDLVVLCGTIVWLIHFHNLPIDNSKKPQNFFALSTVLFLLLGILEYTRKTIRHKVIATVP